MFANLQVSVTADNCDRDSETQLEQDMQGACQRWQQATVFFVYLSALCHSLLLWQSVTSSLVA